MNRPPAHTLDELLQDDAFVDWIRLPTPDRTRFWEQQQRDYPHLTPLIEQGREAAWHLSQFHPQENEADVSRIWANITEQIDAASTVVPLGQRWGRWASWVAAAVLLMVGTVWWVRRPTASGGIEPPVALTQRADWRSVANTGSQPERINLPDGSTVTLQPAGRVQFSGTFGQARAVYLSGDAFFEVVKNPARPFLVHTDQLTTKVLGTSFWVRARPGDAGTTVQVRTGRVAVYPRSANPDPARSLVLTPNQEATYRAEAQQLTRSLVDAPQPVTPAAQLPPFVYEDVPAARIFAAIEATYGIDIVYDPAAFATCEITTSLTDESLYKKLDILCKLTGTTYQVVDGQVVIEGSGCVD